MGESMKLSNEAIQAFKRIHFEETGERLSDEKAQSLGLQLLRFFKLIYKPIPKDYVESQKLTNPETK